MLLCEQTQSLIPGVWTGQLVSMSASNDLNNTSPRSLGGFVHKCDGKAEQRYFLTHLLATIFLLLIKCLFCVAKKYQYGDRQFGSLLIFPQEA